MCYINYEQHPTWVFHVIEHDWGHEDGEKTDDNTEYVDTAKPVESIWKKLSA